MSDVKLEGWGRSELLAEIDRLRKTEVFYIQLRATLTRMAEHHELVTEENRVMAVGSIGIQAAVLDARYDRDKLFAAKCRAALSESDPEA